MREWWEVDNRSEGTSDTGFPCDFFKYAALQDEMQQEHLSAAAASKRGLVLEYAFKPGRVEQHQGDVVGHNQKPQSPCLVHSVLLLEP